jgi:glucosamine--fructose-6-phosphate aminotransferase (isomerizing)
MASPGRGNAYIDDVLDQPAAILRTLDALAQPLPGVRDIANGLRGGRYNRLILTGMGASHAALHHLLFRITPHGHYPLLVDTAELLDDAESILSEGSVLVVVSQSGRTSEVVRLLDQVGNRPVIAITNDAASPLARRATFAYVTAAGDEHSVICKTYVSALAAMVLMTDDLVGRPRDADLELLRAGAGLMRAYLEQWSEKAIALAEFLGGARSLVVVGRGHSLCSSEAGAMILREASRIHAESVSGAQFRHGHMEMINSGAAVLIFRGHGQAVAHQERLAKEITQHGGRVLRIGETSDPGPASLPAVNDQLLPFLEILPVQLASIGLAWRDRLEPGLFSAHPKVRTDE